MSLQNILNDTASLLHDNNFLFNSQKTLITWINEARRQVAQRTGCIQRVISGQSAFGAGAQPGSFIPGGAQPGALPGSAPNAQNSATTNLFNTIVGVERYPYIGFANPFLKGQHEGCKGIIDTLAVSVSWGGSPRPTLAWLPWMDLQAYARAYSLITESYPYFWSTLNDGENGEVWLFPVPSFAMEMEWQIYAVPTDIYTNDDYDVIPDGFKNAVKFGAASLAFMSSQRWAQAQLMMNLFTDRLGVARVAVDSGKTPNYYWSAI